MPLTGDWLITDPAGTVVLDAVVTAADRQARVRDRRRRRRPASGRPRSASPTCGKPDDTTSATALSDRDLRAAAGVWLITDPAGTVVLDALVDRADRQAARS